MPSTPPHEKALGRVLETLVDETTEPGDDPVTPRELLEVLRQADTRWVTWQVSGGGDTHRVDDFRDAVFEVGREFMEAARSADAGGFDVRDLPGLVERSGGTSESDVVRQATRTAAYDVEVEKRRTQWRSGDVLAIPVGTGYRLAVVLPRTSFGWAVGVLDGTFPVPRAGSLDSPRADTWFYTEQSEYLSGRWPKIGREPGLVKIFPEVLERFHYRPLIVPSGMGDAVFGFAEAPDGAFRKLEKDEAERLGILDGTYHQSHLSRDVARFLAGRHH